MNGLSLFRYNVTISQDCSISQIQGAIDTAGKPTEFLHMCIFKDIVEKIVHEIKNRGVYKFTERHDLPSCKDTVFHC